MHFQIKLNLDCCFSQDIPVNKAGIGCTGSKQYTRLEVWLKRSIWRMNRCQVGFEISDRLVIARDFRSNLPTRKILLTVNTLLNHQNIPRVSERRSRRGYQNTVPITPPLYSPCLVPLRVKEAKSEGARQHLCCNRKLCGPWTGFCSIVNMNLSKGHL